MRNIKSITAAILVTGLALTACGSSDTENTAEVQSTVEATTPAPAVSATQEPIAAPTPEAASIEGVYEFGETLENGSMTLTVSAPTAFTPTQYAVGAVPGSFAVYFEVTISNTSSEVLEPFVYSTLSSGGAEASQIFDSGNTEVTLEGAPSTALLPGKSVTWNEGFSVLDPEDIIYQVSTDFATEPAIFTNVK